MKLAAFMCALLPAVCAAQFRADVHLVNVGFSVRDSQGKLVPGLSQDDFEVLEDGVPQKIAFFARSQDVPLNLGLVVDVSGSQESFVKAHLKDLETFLKSVLAPHDRAFLLCFGNRLRLASDFSSSPEDLVESLQQIGRRGDHVVFQRKGKRRIVVPDSAPAYPELGPPELRSAGTAFYDAIYYSINDKLAAIERGRRALIVFSDGEDNSSAHHMLDAIETAQANDVLLFSIRYTEAHSGRLTARNKYGTRVMERIARETGGSDFDAPEKGMAANFQSIGEELRSSYELGYHSANPLSDDSFHKIVIRANTAGLRVRAKTGYFARSGDR